MKKIVIAGGSGFLGSRLSKYFGDIGYRVFSLSRSHRIDCGNTHFVKWNGEETGMWVDVLEDADALINLSGRSVDCRYNAENKEVIYDSRLKSTYILGKTIEQCKKPPKVWINSSSATIYRHSTDKEMTEANGEYGAGFSVDVCKKWEGVFRQFDSPEVRNVTIRTAIVLGRNAPVLKPLVKLVRIGLGGRQGNGRQYFSWIHEDDFCTVIDSVISNDKMNGVYNLAAPKPVTNRKLMALLRKKVGVPFGIPLNQTVLEIGAKMIGTETELVLKSRRVVPKRLLDEGYSFKFASIDRAIDDVFYS